MANKTITDLTAASALDSDDVVPVDEDGVTRKATITQLAAATAAAFATDAITGTDVAAATDTTRGSVELATIAETNTGTDTSRAVTPDGLAGSVHGEVVAYVQVTDPSGSAITTGDGKGYFLVPPTLNGMNLVDADAMVSTVSSSGTPTFQIARVRSGSPADMLSTRITIDASESTSYTAATAPVIDSANDDVATGDMLRFDFDVAGTGTKGVGIVLTFRLP